MKFITSLVLSLFAAHCIAEGDVIWDSKSEKSQLTLETGPMEKRWGGTGNDELFFRVKDGTRTLFSWGMVGPVVGLIQEGVAMSARGKTIEIIGIPPVRFLESGSVELLFRIGADNFTVQITAAEARELVLATNRYFIRLASRNQNDTEKDGLD